VVLASAGEQPLVRPEGGLHIPLDDPQRALALIDDHIARHGPFQAVIGTDDSTVPLASAVAARLALAHNPVEAVRLARRKDLARARLAEAGVRVPRHRVIDTRVPLAPQLADFPFPCVVKPVSMSGSRGVIRADDQEALLRAASRARAIAAGLEDPDERERLLIEAFIPGMEVALEGLLRGGRLTPIALFDKPDPLDGPFFEETYYVTPSRLPGSVREQVAQEVERACRAYGLCEGPVHAECRINDDGAWILEVAARTIGGLCSRLFTLGAGRDLEDVVLGHALGTTQEVSMAGGAGGVLMIPIPGAGILRRVEGVLDAQRVPGVAEVVIAVREGYELVPLPEGDSYLGFIFARAATPERAEEALREAHARLRVVVAPLWKIDPASQAG
jgi:biotin carboxylase